MSSSPQTAPPRRRSHLQVATCEHPLDRRAGVLGDDVAAHRGIHLMANQFTVGPVADRAGQSASRISKSIGYGGTEVHRDVRMRHHPVLHRAGGAHVPVAHQ
eukprot:scaffold27_cov355-Prasinococcus_capsulatus_cf.AAC.8